MKEGLICLDSMKFTSGRLTTAKQVLNRVLTHLKIPRTDWKVYGLWLKSENLRECLSTCNVYWLAFTDFLYQCWPNQSIHCHVTDNNNDRSRDFVWEILSEHFNTYNSLLSELHVYMYLPTIELQLKSYHLPYKLFKRWKDLLSQYTNATYENVCTGEFFWGYTITTLKAS